MNAGVSWHPLPMNFRRIVAESDRALLLETARQDRANDQSLLFLDPCSELIAERASDLEELLREVDLHLAAGCFVAGYFAYECGETFLSLSTQNNPLRQPDRPLAWLGVYRNPLRFDHSSGAICGNLPVTSMDNGTSSSRCALVVEGIEVEKADYESKIARVREYLLAGDTYQVNFTDRISGSTDANPLEIYNLLLAQQPVSFAAFVNQRDDPILSFSPELFYRTWNGQITVRPMKGTWSRGFDIQGDREAAEALRNDEKNRSEHITIVDLLRNDVGRISEPGSVHVEGLLAVERYATLLQMTSTISGRLLPHLTPSAVFQHLFPSGSITGAPKRRTMEIIRELESGPRGVYTGAIGYFGPQGEACFNVAIRTLTMGDGSFSMGVGGGITADSCAVDEYQECQMKASFLTKRERPFSLIETMRCSGGIALLPYHLRRLADSAAYFEISYDEDSLRREIKTRADRAGSLETTIRLELHQNGTWQVTSSPLDSPPWRGRILLADDHTSSRNVFLRHKTTNRGFYDQRRSWATNAGFDEVIFLNEQSQIAEGSITNLFLEIDGQWVTPPLSCGVLPGVQRAAILRAHPDFREQTIDLTHVSSVKTILLCNALRGVLAVKTVEREDGSIVWQCPSARLTTGPTLEARGASR